MGSRSRVRPAPHPAFCWRGTMRRIVVTLTILCSLITAAVGARGGTPAPASASGWATPIVLGSASAGIVDVALSVSEAGVAHVVWDDDGRLLHAHGAPTVNPAAGEVAEGASPALVGGQGGAAHLAFAARYDDQADIYEADWDGSAWSLPVSLLSSAGDSFAPAADRWDTLLAVAWTERGAAYDEVYLATRSSPGPWLGSAVPGISGSAADVCLDGQGIHLLFQQIDPGTLRQQLGYTVRIGMDWSLPVSVSNTPAFNASAGRLACSAGNAHAVWQQETATGYRIYYAAGSSAGWGSAMPVSGATDAFSPDLAQSADGSLHVAWAQTGAVAYRRWVAGTWGATETVPVPGLIVDVAVGVAPNGTVHLAWAELGGDGLVRVMYAWRPADTPTPTATPTRTATRTPTATATRTLSATPTATRPPVVKRLFLPVVFRGPR